MFQNKKQNILEGNDSSEREQSAEIHTIPHEFYGARQKKDRSKTIKTAAFIIVALLLIAGSAILFIYGYQQEQAQTNPKVITPQVSDNSNSQEGNQNINNSPVANINQPLRAEISATPEVVAPSSSASLILPSAIDSDQDGLTDEEEKIYHTDPMKPDTDGDSYSDSQEVANFYNPSGIAPKTLLDSGLVKTYINPSFNYSIFYSSSWIVRSLDETNGEVLFTSATGEFVQVLVQDNPTGLSAKDWYLGENTEAQGQALTAITTKDGLLQGVESPDGLNVYFAAGNKIYIIAYSVGTREDLNFKATFNMMARSFHLGSQ